MRDLGFQAAEPKHHDAVMSLFDEARRWHESVEVNVWPKFDSAKVMVEIKENKVFILTHDARVLGTVTLFDSDPLIWSDNKPALYIHRLATLRSLRGRGLCKIMIDHVSGLALGRQKTMLRLDCWADNEKLKRYYEELGFMRLGDLFMGEARELPAHYWNSTTTLFEMHIESQRRLAFDRQLRNPTLAGVDGQAQ